MSARDETQRDGLTRREREDLAALARKREKVAKSDASQRTAELLAKFEEELATEFRADDEHWRDVTAAAEAAVAAARKELAARLDALGVPERFRPALWLHWSSRGENSSKERRAELRKVAATRLAAMEKDARLAIERASLEVQTTLLAGGLDTAAARAFLEAMPTAEALMPPLRLDDVRRFLPGASWTPPALAAAVEDDEDADDDLAD
jgi:hypothetical protein